MLRLFRFWVYRDAFFVLLFLDLHEVALIVLLRVEGAMVHCEFGNGIPQM
jgi:hypothetical protein